MGQSEKKKNPYRHRIVCWARYGNGSMLIRLALLSITSDTAVSYRSCPSGFLRIDLTICFSFFQGFLVTLFFCFLNTEVRNTVRHHWTRRQTSRWLEHSQNHNSRGRCGTALNSNRDSKDGSRAPCESTR